MYSTTLVLRVLHIENLLSLHIIKTVDDETIMDDFIDDDLDLASMHSSNSSEIEGDALEVAESW